MNISEDKVCEFLDACWNAGIKDPVAYLLSKRPQVYDWLKGAFPRGILPTDIDGEVEVGGQFLRLEFKHETALRNGHMPKGQIMALRKLSSTGLFTVMIIGIGVTAEPTCVIAYKCNGEITGVEDADRTSIRERCRLWSEWADKRAMQKPKPRNNIDGDGNC